MSALREYLGAFPRMLKSRNFWTWLGTLVLLITVASFLAACNGFTYGAEDGITLSDITLIDPTRISSPAMRR